MRLLRKPLPHFAAPDDLRNTARTMPVLRNIHRPLSERTRGDFSRTVPFKSADLKGGRGMRWGSVSVVSMVTVFQTPPPLLKSSSQPSRIVTLRLNLLQADSSACVGTDIFVLDLMLVEQSASIDIQMLRQQVGLQIQL